MVVDPVGPGRGCPRHTAQMPFAEEAGGISGGLKDGRDRGHFGIQQSGTPRSLLEAGSLLIGEWMPSRPGKNPVMMPARVGEQTAEGT